MREEGNVPIDQHIPEESEVGQVLRMEGISKRFPGTLAVDDVDFTGRAGEVHALVGENGAGKSTLMKTLAGTFDDYDGCIRVSGREVELHSPATAKRYGIGMIYQELSLAGPVSIAENVLVGRLPRKWGCVLDRDALVRRARRCLARVGLEVDPLKPVEELSLHQAQLVEIARVLDEGPCVLVMDEPTSALSRKEVQRLFEIIGRLRDSGMCIIYISHHLSEVFEVSDRITVLRDGRRISTLETDETSPSEVVRHMVGQQLEDFYAEHTREPGQPVLNVGNLTREGFFHDVSFRAREGEILGIAGLAGAGRTEGARSMCGLDPLDSGRVMMDGQDITPSSYGQAIEQGLFYLTEDRQKEGLFPRLSVRENLLSAVIQRHTRWGVYRSGHEEGLADRMVEELDIVAPSRETDVRYLSGGNQQKLLLGKWLLTEPQVLVLDEPTRGVDVQAKRKIHQVIAALADRGRTVLLISSDLPELVGLSDRVVVLRRGHVFGEISGAQLTEDNVLLAANGDDTAVDG